MSYVKMAAPTSVRTLSSITRFSRAILFNRIQKSPGIYSFSTTVSEDKVASDKAEPASDPKNKETEETGSEVEYVPQSESETKLLQENDKLKADYKTVTNKYMRALAETENVRTRMQKQVQDTKLFGIQGFCKDLLDVADILNQAMDTVPKEELEKNQHLKTLFEGLTMTNKQMEKVFGKHGLVKIQPAVGDKFDPFFHEALFQVPAQGDSKPDTVAIIQKTGYQLHERTLRPALVGVFKS